MSKSIYNKPKAGKMRTKMRSRIHVVLVRVSEFHPLKERYGTHPTAQDSGLFVVNGNKEISANTEIFILTSLGCFLSDGMNGVKAKALERCLRQP